MISRGSYLQGAYRIRNRLSTCLIRPPAATVLRVLSFQVSRSFHISDINKGTSIWQDQVTQRVSDAPFKANTTALPISTPSSLITAVRTCPTGDFVTVTFTDTTFTFHAQWLHDARMDDGPYKQVTNTYTHKNNFVQIRDVGISGHGIKTALKVSWNDGHTTQFPAVWLRVYAPLVAKHHDETAAPKALQIPNGWLAHTLTMPEISYTEIFPEISNATALRIHEILVHDAFPGILKVTNLPLPIVEEERKGKNTLLVQVFKQIFGSVFVHPRRGAEIAYTMASHHQGSSKGKLLPNYNTSAYLLPHFDQSIYQNPTLVDGLYNVEGESINTFVSCPAVLQTLKEESPELVEPLLAAPMAFGRVAHMYSPPQYQASTQTVVTTRPGFPHQVYRFRWNPHQVGALLSPFSEFPTAILAHRKFQEIASRDTHQLKVWLKPGDMYLFDNFKVLHGREKVLKVPRTAVGQTVPEQAVVDGWREMLTARLLKVLEERWLVHVPLAQLYELDKMVNELEA